MARKPAEPAAAPARTYFDDAAPVSRAEFEAFADVVRSLVSPPKVDGKQLFRCRCGDFATQRRALNDPLTGTTYQDTCDVCEMAHPLVGQRGTELSSENFPEAMLSEARRLNAARQRVRVQP